MRQNQGRAFRLYVRLVLVTLGILGLVGCGESVPSSPTPNPSTNQEPASAPTQILASTASSEAVASQSEISTSGVTIEFTEGSIARYLVREELARRSLPNDATGETTDVNGVIVFDADGKVQPERSRVVVDMRTLRSDEDRRDSFLRDSSLESNEFPLAEFIVQETPGLPWPLPESGEVAFQLKGDMTLHGVTSQLTWDVVAEFSSGTVTGQSGTNFTFDKFDMEKPSLFFILSVDDDIRLELDFNASYTSTFGG